MWNADVILGHNVENTGPHQGVPHMSVIPCQQFVPNQREVKGWAMLNRLERDDIGNIYVLQDEKDFYTDKHVNKCNKMIIAKDTKAIIQEVQFWL